MRTFPAFVFFVCLASAAAAQQFDPAYRFHTFQTEHFFIHFHQGEDAQAGRLARIAEDTWQGLRNTLGPSAPRKTHVILVDETDLSNGWATPLPRDTIAVYAVWPAGSDPLKSDDWLRLVFTHEFTHIVHLDRSEGVWRAVRAVFGRTPVAFPNLLLPVWQIEGIAVYEESALTGEGRLHAGDFRAIVDEAGRARRLLPLDRVNGGLTRWPAGDGPYAYGLGFHAYLADQYGSDKLRALADQTSRALPFLGSLAFTHVFGKPLSTLWREYEAAAAASASSPDVREVAARLTHHNYDVIGPRFAPPSCPDCAREVYYSVRDADEFPSLYRLRLNAGVAGPPERVTTRFFGSTNAPGSERIYFDQQEFHRNAGLYSDLYSLDRSNGRVRRLTNGARLIDPDLSPDGRTMSAVRVRPGQRDLVLVHLASPDHISSTSTLATGNDVQFNAPRWSPDGRRVAVERQRLGEPPAIVVIDAATGSARVIAADSRARWATPTWRRDGGAVIAAAASGDDPFNLYEIDLATLDRRQITHTTGGATWPDVSLDGRSIVYVGYGADGFDLFQMPYTSSGAPAGPAGARQPPPTSIGPGADAPTSDPTPPGGVALARPYVPWTTLAPTWWSPIIERSNQQWLIGAATTGSDVLGYHNYSGSLTWRARTTQGVPATGASPDWHLSYDYARWRLTLFTSTSKETTFFVGPAEASGLVPASAREERTLEAGVLLPIVHARTTQLGFASVVRVMDRLTTTGGTRSFDRSAVRLGWSFSSAHGYGNSISLERGVAVGATTELNRRTLGSTADSTTTAADGRVYAPGLTAHHVLAIRAAAGATTGDVAAGRTFFLGGGDSSGHVLDFGSEALSLLRGFPVDTFAGTKAALLNVDYRWPILRVERGLGSWPIFLHTIHAAVFADAGNAWTREFHAEDLKTSVGVELSSNIVVGYRLPLTFVVGAGKGHDGTHIVPDRATVYIRLGYAF